MERERGVIKGLLYIQEHLGEALSLKDIAFFVGYSEYHYERVFKQWMGMGVMEYVKEQRLQQAWEQIQNGEKIITVAFRYGYQSHSGFTKAFKRRFGISPSLVKAMNVQLQYLKGVEFMKRNDWKKEELRKYFMEQLNENKITEDMKMVQEVYEFAEQVYRGMKRYSGEEYITHMLHIAILLVKMEADLSVVLAGMFCDSFKKTNVTKLQLEQHLSDEVVSLIVKTNDFSVEEGGEISEEVILIKLAERLHNMQTLEYMEEGRRREKAMETMEWFLPLARELGNDMLCIELNKLSLQYIE